MKLSTALAPCCGDNMSSTTREGVDEGYAVLPLDDLRPHAEKIEAQILKQAGIKFDPKADSSKLRVLA
jgi:hypothetical protein